MCTLQQQLQDLGVKAQINLIGETFCFVSFSDENSMDVFLRTRLHKTWFSKVRVLEESDFADGQFGGCV